MTRPVSGGGGVGTQIHFQKTAPRQLEHWEEGGRQAVSSFSQNRGTLVPVAALKTLATI